MKQWSVIGVAGLTNSGKTSVAQALHDKFPDSTLLRQDDYFLPIHDPRHVHIPQLGHINWELLSSLDMDKMYSDISHILKTEAETPKLLILEGFLLFNDQRISDVCDLRFFIDLDYETCRRRRAMRTYDPPDVPGYFETVVWPEALKSRDEMKERVKSVIFLDGQLSIPTLLDTIIQTINGMFKIKM